MLSLGFALKYPLVACIVLCCFCLVTADAGDPNGEKRSALTLLVFTSIKAIIPLFLCKAIIFYKNSFYDILKNITKYPQVIKNIKVNQDKKQSILLSSKLQECITLCESLLLDDGRIVVRASGTEPVIRVMTEGKDYELINKLADTIINTIQQLN